MNYLSSIKQKSLKNEFLFPEHGSMTVKSRRWGLERTYGELVINHTCGLLRCTLASFIFIDSWNFSPLRRVAFIRLVVGDGVGANFWLKIRLLYQMFGSVCALLWNNASRAFGKTSAGIEWCFFGGYLTLSAHFMCVQSPDYLLEQMSREILSYMISLQKRKFIYFVAPSELAKHI